MIARLRGRVWEIGSGYAVLDVHGVGYRVDVPLSTWEQLNTGQEADLRVYTQVREDALTLFGFATVAERDMFESLLGVTGIGAKTALNIVSAVPPERFRALVQNQDLTALTKVPGVGKKTGERILLELRDRMISRGKKGSVTLSEEALPSGIEGDALAALVGLGYDLATAKGAIDQELKETPHSDAATLVRGALRRLAEGRHIA